MIGSRFSYTLLLWALLPRVFWHLIKRSRRQPAYLEHVAERFGFYATKADKPVIWLHAVSVGETRAASPLIVRLLQTYPQHQILVTHMTPTGRQTGEELYGGRVLRCYLPYDFPFAVRSFLDRFQPVLGLLMETELWFNLIHECKERGTPVLLVNARLSEKSAAKYARVGKLARSALQELAMIAAQTESDARRLISLGAPDVKVTGNLKFDLTPAAEALALGAKLRQRFGEHRQVLLAASTREGEETMILDALEAAGIPGLLTVIVPRHPQRFDEVASLLQKRGLKYQRRSAEEAIGPDTQIVLGDSMGEMFAYYRACDLAFIGGSLLPFGGQNLIEACAVGKPVLIGPHTYNFDEATKCAVEAGAARRVADAKELARQAGELIGDPQILAAMANAGRNFAAHHRGTAERVTELITAILR